MPRRLHVFLALLALAPAARAQFVLFDLPGGAAGDFYGTALAGGHDVDGDGRPDFVIGARNADVVALNGGRVEVRSGAGGGLVWALDGTVAGERLGHAVGLVGDMGGDGRSEVLVGAPFNGMNAWNGGLARVVSGLDASPVHHVAGAMQFGLLGSSVTGCGDVDGDGVPDFVVGAPDEDAGGTDSGVFYVHSGATGGVLWALIGLNSGDRMGRSIAGAGDVNGDGHADVIGGADREAVGGLLRAGVARVASGPNGALLFVKQGTQAEGRLGFSVAGVGDVNGDGRDDFAASAIGETPNGTDSGRVYVWSGTTGAVLHVFEGAQAGDQLGYSIAGIGDVDGDGRPDILVGAPGEQGGRGAARVYSGASGALLHVTFGDAPGDRLGEAVANVGDVDGDGLTEWAVGAPFASVNGASSGRVLVLSTTNPAGSAYCFGDGSGNICPCGNSGDAGRGCASSSTQGARLVGTGFPSVASDSLVFALDGARAGQPVLLFAGLNAVAGGLGNPFGDGLRCAGGSIRRLGVRIAVGGEAQWGPGLATTHGWQAGDVRRMQAWYRDPTSSPCGTGFNLSNGFATSWLP